MAFYYRTPEQVAASDAKRANTIAAKREKRVALSEQRKRELFARRIEERDRQRAEREQTKADARKSMRLGNLNEEERRIFLLHRLVWNAMKFRCYNPKCKQFKDYGGRGISVCDRWLESFDNFLLDMNFRPDDDHQLDRIDNNGNYEPGNCRWVPRAINMKNQRRTGRFPALSDDQKRSVFQDSVTMTVKEIAEKYNVNRQVIYSLLAKMRNGTV